MAFSKQSDEEEHVEAREGIEKVNGHKQNLTNMLCWLFALLLSQVAVKAAPTPTTVMLLASPNPSTLGRPVTLVATVTPSAATGKITFYDGTTVLGTGTLSSGQATLTAYLLPSGNRALRAYYGGDAGYAAAESAPLPQIVNAVPATMLAGPATFAAGHMPQDVAVGDFDGNGTADLVTANWGDDVTVLLNNGDGTFRTAQHYAAGTSPYSVAVADFNRDGKPDLAVGNVNSKDVSVLLGNGDGNFQATVNYAVAQAPNALAIADFNRDGKADLAVAVSGNGVNAIAVLLGNGDGTFQTPTMLPVPGPGCVEVGDFNRDGNPDLAVADRTGGNAGVLLGNGDGTFQPPVNYAAGPSPWWVSVGDFNGDGKEDLAIVDTVSPTVSVLLGNGNGTFAAAVNYATYNGALTSVVGDFNGDGKVDLAVGGNGGIVGVLIGNGDGTFQPVVTYFVSRSVNFIAVADFTGDGRTDLAGSNTSYDTVSVLPGIVASPDLTLAITHTGNFTAGQTGAAYTLTVANAGSAPTAGSVTVMDQLPTGLSATALSGKGWDCQLATVSCSRTDALAAGAAYPGITLTVNVAPGLPYALMNAGRVSGGGEVNTTNNIASDPTTILAATSTTLTSSPSPAVYGQTVLLTAMVSPSGATGKVTFYDGTNVLGTRAHSGGQATLTTRSLASGTRSLWVHYEGDSIYAASNSAPQPLAVNPAIANTFTTAASYATGTGPYAVAVGDFNGDGKADLATANEGGKYVTLLLGNGDGSFQAPLHYAAGGTVSFLAVGDFNGDGKADLAVANIDFGTVTVLLGNGAGGFQGPPVTLDVGLGPDSIAVADFNADGKPDLAVTNSGNNTVGVLLGNGDGTFREAVNYTVGMDRKSVAAADFNHDGRVDLAISNSGSNSVSVLLGNGDGTFREAVNYTPGTAPASVAVGDFDGDGNADLAVANARTYDVSVLLGNGDGTFRAPVSYGSFIIPWALVVEDFNGDGRADLAVVDQGANAVIIRQNQGNGTFQAGTAYPVGSFPWHAVAADFNGDGRPDLAVANYADGTVSVLAGSWSAWSGPDLTVAKTHTGNFGQGRTGSYTITARNVGNAATSGLVTVADTLPPGLTATAISGAGWNCGLTPLACSRIDPLANGAAYPSITVTVNVAGNAGPSVINTATVSGGGDVNAANNTASDQTSVGASTITTVTSSPNPAVFGQSVILTVTVTSGATGKVTFYDGMTVLGVGTLSAGQVTLTARFLPSGTRSLWARYAGDATHSSSDSAPVTEAVTPVAANTFAPAVTYAAGLRPEAVAIGDFNGDGKADLATADLDGISVLLGNGNGSFLPPLHYSVGAQPLFVVVGDFNGDGKADLAVATFAPAVSILLGKGDGTFQPPVGYGVGAISDCLAVADFNGDGISDLVVTNSGSHGVGVMLGVGDGTFQALTSYVADSDHKSVAVGDFNGDGRADVAIVTFGSDYLAVLLGNGDGTFQAPVYFAAGARPESIAVADFNGDGKADLAIATTGSREVRILLGDGHGSFTLAYSYGAMYAWRVLAEDFNGDGKLDLAVIDISADKVILLRGNGNGSFQPGVTFPSSTGPWAAATGDFNGDGRPDLAVATGDIGVYLGIWSTPFLTVSKTHTGNFSQGQSGAAYTITVRNTGSGPTVSTVSVTDTLPPGLTATAVSGQGWTCALPTVTCTRSDALPAGASYPAITVTINAGINAPAQVTNVASVSGGGSAAATATDVTVILPQSAGSILSVGKSATQSSTVAGYPTAAASSAVDGNSNGNFAAGSVTHTNQQNNPWWQVDLGSSATVNAVVIWNRSDCCGERLSDYWVFVSDTPFASSDTPATLQSRAGTWSSHQRSTPAPAAVIVVPGAQGRYVRIQLSAAGMLSLAEVQVTGTLVVPAGTNIALGKPASQSSTVAGYPTAAASSAVDGNTNGSFAAGTVTHTNLGTNAWWEVDLGGVATIQSIVIWNRTDCCVERLSDYWVFVSNTPFGATDTPATLQTRTGTWSNHQTSVPNLMSAIAAGGVQGRYVRVQLAGTGYLSLAEVQMIGTMTAAPAPVNLAEGKAASQSSTPAGYPSAAASSAVDGNTNGNFAAGTVLHTNLDVNAWWQVDLGASATVSSIVIWNRTDCCSSRLSDYWVFISNTPFGPLDTPANLQTRAGTWSSHQTSMPNPSATITVPGAQGRYVRVQLSGTDYLSLAEVQVMGVPGAQGTSNVALNKAASQSSTPAGYSSAAASSAVDGNTNGNFAAGTVMHTNLDVNAWWQVDLGAPATVSSIVIWNRTDCCSSRLGDYWVFVSDTPFGPSDTPATLQSRAGTWASHQTSAPNPSTTIPIPSAQGRYVRVQLFGTGYLSMAEVQVF